MVKIVVETFGEDALRKLFLDLSQKDDWDEECDVCSVVILDVRAPKLAPATFRNTIGYILQVINSNIYTSLHTAPQQFHTRSGSE